MDLTLFKPLNLWAYFLVNFYWGRLTFAGNLEGTVFHIIQNVYIFDFNLAKTYNFSLQSQGKVV